MQFLETLIQKFWQNTISQQELEQLQKLLEENNYEFKGNQNNTLSNILANEKTVIEPEKAKAILKVLHQKIAVKNRKNTVVKSLYNKKIWWAAAASIIVLVGSFFFSNKLNDKKNTGYTNVTIPQKNYRKVVTNNDGNVMTIVLKDNSTIQLYPSSSISYTEPFASTQRNISLVGKAFFKVTKNKQLPFTVTANGFATTALGTEFTVNTLANNTVSVKLFEGKVVVRAIEKTANWVDQYLLPNQEFAYNSITKKYTVLGFGNKALMAMNNAKKPVVKETAVSTASLAFNNEPLQQVFNNLQVIYQVKLVFNTSDINGLYFTGTFSKQDDIKNILSIICNINGLQFVDNGEQIITINKTK